MQTATNPQTGEKVQWDGSAWVPVGSAPAAPQPMGVTTVGTPRPKLPSPQTAAQAENDQLTVELKRTELGQKDKELRGKDIDRETGLRKEFEGLDAVKQYRTVLPMFASAMKAGDNGAGDLNIIYALGKTMDPTSAVREGELEMASTTGSAGEQLKGWYQQISRGGRLTPAVRQQLLSELRVRSGAIADAYNQVRSEYKGLSGKYDMDAGNVVGQHPGAPFQQAEADFLGRPVRNLDGSQGVAPSGSQPQQSNPLYAQLEQEYRAQGLEVDYDENGKPIPVLTGASVGKPASPNADAFMSGVGDVVEGAFDVPGLIANPLNAGINAAFGTNLGTDLGQSARDALGLPDNSHPLAAAINEGGTAALTGAGLANVAARGATGVTQSVANTVASQPIRQGIGGMGAGAGSQQAEERGVGPLGQFGAGLVGGLAGYGGASAANSLMDSLSGTPNALAQTASRQNVQLIPADVGGPVVRRVTGAATQTPFSAAPVVKATQRTQDEIGAAANRAASREGTILPADEAGQSIRAAGQSFSRNQATRIGRIYDRADERAKGVSIKPRNAVAVIDEQLARLGQLGETNAPLIRSLQKLKGDIGNGVKVSGMRDARTSLSQGVYDGKLRSNQEKAIYKSVIDALSTDIEAGLSAAGRKDALNMFKVADKAWRERIEYIDTILEPVIGKGRSGEDVLGAVERMARGKSGGVQRLSGLLKELPDEEAANIRATIVDRLGRARAGQQDAEGGQFSAGTFLTRWNEMSPKGKIALFGNGELRQNLDDIARLADATKQTGKYASFSNTPAGILGNAGIIAATGMTSPKAAMLAAVVQFGTGRLMASPRFTSLLARAPNNPKAMPSYIEQLGRVAAVEPIIANDIASIQNFLRSPQTRAAASTEDEQ